MFENWTCLTFDFDHIYLIIKQTFEITAAVFFSESENAEFIQTEAVERLHQLLPHKVNVEFDNTNVTLSMHSQNRWVNTLQSGGYIL